ncbi:MAG: PQQ-binding-like beta-propeller repeat protein [Flavobacteriales bacterium]
MRLSALLFLLLPITLVAQKAFPEVWESKWSVGIKSNSYSPDMAYVYGGDLNAIQMLDGNTGKSLWIYNFKEKRGVKQCQRWRSDDATETFQVVFQKGKNDPEEIIYLDYAKGEVVAASQVEARTKVRTKPVRRSMRNRKVNQSSCYDEATNTTIDVGYDYESIISAKGGKDLNITVEASGKNAWKANFTGKVVRHLNNDMLPADEGDVILSVSTGYGKVFVVYEGITCLDLVSGKILWSTTFDNVEYSGGLKAKQEIGRSAMPFPAADGVYICDFSKGERAIKKLDLNTGAIIWQSETLKKDDIVSELLVDGGNLIARFGGLIRVEEYIPGMNGNPDVYKVNYVFEGSTSLRAYNATTGKAAWHTADMDLPDNFKKSECNILSDAGRIYACGEKNMYVFETATGKLLKQGEYNAKAIGSAKALYRSDESFMIEGEDGIAKLSAELVPTYATNTGQCLMAEFRGDAFIVWTGKKPDERSEFIRMDPNTGVIMGKMSDCMRPKFDPTGDRFLKFDGSKVTQYRTN